MNADEISSWIISIIVLTGSVLSLISAFGLIRLPDIYTRSHAATKASTLSVMCILIAAFLFFAVGEGLYSARILLGIVFVFITAPVGGHLISRAAYHTGVTLWDSSIQDQLKEKKRKQRPSSRS
ncbi:monovalent cation/H(+) antiporter subunit G [Salibacterium qingdaonense]|uniref:Multisubunit sodium/proton antiporter, MrpG subunit n=1 Tax=Salibacterium qingdaonense TaxID=266892 RepID=A0A1I4JFG1_9BACI|nr:monovalent cation/H(+) antiporter subunit G [Salibacterium qingdaonense]SFL65315.1 multisubunit sodium/proton antiporter, MrpG subunit [Salibacterium qingdaonense]